MGSGSNVWEWILDRMFGNGSWIECLGMGPGLLLILLLSSLCSVSPTTSIESPFRILPTLEESDTFSYKQTTHAPPFKKASTLPTNMNPSDIMNFNYLGGNGPNYPNHNSTSNNHTNNNNGYHYKRVESGGRRLNGYSNNHNNGAIDNFDCINELLDEGLEYSSNVRRKERVSIGGEVDRRRVFPAESSSHNYSRTRSNTLQK